MDKSDIEKVITALMERSNPKYTSPCGAFLELLREYAKNDEIEKIAESCKLYFAKSTHIKKFVSEKVPGILVNHHFTVRPDLDYEKFILLSLNTKDWATGIVNNSTNSISLRTEVERIIKKSNSY